ncbi:MAG: diphosphomevalonate decarboxylase [Proteobacteria bacterium]|nr:MAG: diphosphomevalonate decarboxylase [Pseudomonadota bacterium]
MSQSATARAYVNIALVKYWGKRDLALNLPAAGSLSLTLDELYSTTTVSVAGGDDELANDQLLIDGELASAGVLNKALRVVDPLRARAGLVGRPVSIVSDNTVPTAAGLASSASGLAALTVATAAACGLDLSLGELSTLARQGSGSACRSLFGGFARWDAGDRDDGKDSRARPLFDRDHWDLRVVVALVSSRKKSASSTDGMGHTKATSPYHAGFVASVDKDLDDAEAAIGARDFSALARVAERSCLRMHAAMLAADPPLSYLRWQSWRVIEVVRELQRRGVAVFFSADAGPNVKLFCLPEALPAVQQALSSLCDEGLLEDTLETRPGPGAEVLEVSS